MSEMTQIHRKICFSHRHSGKGCCGDVRRSLTLATAMSLGMLLVLMMMGCSDSTSTKSSEKPKTKASQAGQVTNENTSTRTGAAATVLGNVGDFQLLDQNGATINRADLAGNVCIATFIFTRCTLTCPLQSRWMVKLQERLKQEPSRDGIRLISFTVDPEFDTPTVLQQYADGLGADTSHWHFLTGKREEIWSLCKDSFHLPVAESPADSALPIVHDPRVALIDRQGRIRAYFDPVSQDSLDPIMEALNQVLPEFQPPASLWNFDDSDEHLTHLAQPPEILNSDSWLKQRAASQSAALQGTEVFHDFHLTDQIEGSGISFRNQILDEQRSRLQVNHFDHGNGICVADVDGDGLQDLYLVNQAGHNSLCRNLGGAKFEDITEKAGVAVPGRVKVSASFADVNNDGRPDLFVTTVRGGNLLFLNEGEGRFADVSAEYGVNYAGHSSAAVFFDYDRDGFLDLFVANVGKYTTEEVVDVRADRTTQLPAEGAKYFAGMKDAFGGHLKPELNEPSILYHNDAGKKFVDVSAATGLNDSGWSGAALPIDVNEDGWMDLYVMNMQGHDSLWENQQGMSFAEKTATYFPKTPWGTMGGQVFDFDNNGHLDLMLTDMHSDMSETVSPTAEKAKANMKWPESFLKSGDASIYGNAFYRNDGGGKFTEISDQIGAENFWPWGMSSGDINADGYEDAFISSSMCFPYRYSTNALLLNDKGGRFLDSECVTGIEPRAGALIAPWFELDCDGTDKANPLCRNRTGKLVVWSAVGSRSSVLIDIDQDGDLDVITNEFNARPQLLISDLAGQDKPHNYLSLKLVGTKSNREALGSSVAVKSGDRQWHQQHDGQSGYLSQSSAPLYFGLGDSSVIDEISVRWPSGKTQVVAGPVDANQELRIEESE